MKWGINGALSSAGSILFLGIDVKSPVFEISGPSGPNLFGGAAELYPADSVTGPLFVFVGGQLLSIGPSYVVGQPFLSSAIFNGTNLAAEGFTTPGLVGTWTINGTSESINLFIGPPAEVPGPLPLLGAGAAFGWSRRLRRRISAPGITPPQA